MLSTSAYMPLYIKRIHFSYASQQGSSNVCPDRERDRSSGDGGGEHHESDMQNKPAFVRSTDHEQVLRSLGDICVSINSTMHD